MRHAQHLLSAPSPENAYIWALGMRQREFFGRNYRCPHCGVAPGDYVVIRESWMAATQRALYCQNPKHPRTLSRGPFDVEVPAWDGATPPSKEATK